MVWRRQPKRPMENDMERWLFRIRQFSVECGSKALRLETLEAYRQKLGCHVVYMSNPELTWTSASITTTVPFRFLCFVSTGDMNRLVKIAVIHVEAQSRRH
ncbi:hypothetical protein KVT40_005195 [Elsinoe batatas]|uniref:Uncharacterized protein n=1 Tax=Elsinoe batatas TaxID=2601811 RepID=A0A8K0PBW7_9PEZI|nr:hypothetical protein KVT40_005195 [Elsinoe batatas]